MTGLGRQSATIFWKRIIYLPLVLLVPWLAGQESVATVPAAGDTYVSRVDENENQGDQTTLRIGTNGRNRALVRFGTATIEQTIGGEEFIAARLRLYITDSDNDWGSAGRPVNLHRLTEEWTELGATWECPDDTNTQNSRRDCKDNWKMEGFGAAPFESDPTATAVHRNGDSRWVEWDVTDDVADFLAGEESNFGWIVLKDKENQGGRVDYSSREGAFPPELVVVLGPPDTTSTTGLPPANDTYVRRLAPDHNQGDHKVLQVRGDLPNRSLLQFEQSQIVNAFAGGALVSAKLRLRTLFNHGPWRSEGAAINVHRVTEPWTEEGATWNCPDDPNAKHNRSPCDPDWNMSQISEWPFVATPTSSVQVQNKQSGWVEWDVTADVEQFLNGAAPNHGWLIRADEERLSRSSPRHRGRSGSLGRVWYSSREGKYPPQLVLRVAGAPTDNEPPTISANVSPAPNAAGWNNTDVTVTFVCSDEGSGIASCPDPVMVAAEGSGQVVSGQAVDQAGNTSTASVTLNIDKAPPSVAGISPADGATVGSPQLTLMGMTGDALSGIANVSCNASTAAVSESNFSCDLSLLEGANNIAVTAADVADNTAVAALVIFFIPPLPLAITTSVSPPANAAGWHMSDPTVTFECTGGIAPVDCPEPVVIGSEGADQEVAGTATDAAGNTASTSVLVSLDKTASSLSNLAPADGTVVANPDVTVSGSVADGLSGIAGVTCNGSPANLVGSDFTCNVTLSLGPNSVVIEATDVAGNIGSQTLNLTLVSPLTLTFTAPPNLSYLNLSPTTVSGIVSDPSATVTINSIAATTANGSFSTQIPLAEGPNVLTATATTPAGAVATASIQVTLDTTPPHVTITSPPDKFVTTEPLLSFAGIVNDIVVGTVNDEQARVTVNGIEAEVANRMFLAKDVPLNMGENVIQAVARDRVGNAATTQITVTRQAPAPSRIRLLSGNNQTAVIGSVLPAPLVVALTDSDDNPVPNRPVIFKVLQNNGMVSSGGAPAASVITGTDAQGQAQVGWTLGMRSGAGGNVVEAYSVGFGGTAVFTATGTQGPAGKIVVDTGNNQVGEVNKPLPKPFIAVVVDDGNNRLAGVPVTFTVREGGGSFAGQPTTTVTTDSDGRVAAIVTLGFQEGDGNNLVEADFPSNQGFPAAFTASGRAPGDPSKTTISGVVLDNSNVPIEGVTIRAVLTNLLNSNSSIIQSVAAVQTDAEGQFTIPEAPVGFVKLLVDGSTAQRPGSYPTLDYDMVTVAGQTSTVGGPIFLLPLNTANQLCVTATTGGGTLTMPEAHGFSLTFGPGQVTFPGGSKEGCISVTAVHGDKVPMVPGFGQQPRFIVTIQPAGAVFNPPAAITLPNVDGLVPRAVTEMYSFDHDIGSFIAIGTGRVSDDGQVIRSSPGVGVLKAGWHCGGNPTRRGSVADCPICNYCQGATDQSATCIPDPGQIGASCSTLRNVCFTGGACGVDTSLGFNRPTGVCEGGGPVPDEPPVQCDAGGGHPGFCVGGTCRGSGDQCPIPCESGVCVGGQCLIRDCLGRGNGELCSAGGNSPGVCQEEQCIGSGNQCPPACNGGTCLNGICAVSSCTGRPSGTLCIGGGSVPGFCRNGACHGRGNQCPPACSGGSCVDRQCQPPTFSLTIVPITPTVWPQSTPGANEVSIVVSTSPPTANVEVLLELGGVINSGGHIDALHQGSRPVGTLAGNPISGNTYSGRTDANGRFVTTYKSEHVSGQVVIFASAGAAHDSFTLTVAVPNLAELGPDAHYSLIGFDTTPWHPEGTNHWGTSPVNLALKQIADAYFDRVCPAGNCPCGLTPVSRTCLHYNDQSLPLGGKFDLSHNWGAGGLHQGHKLGTEADVRIWNIDMANRDDFEDIARAFGATPEIHNAEAGCGQTPTLCHYHLKF